MAAPEYDLTIERGDTETFRFRLFTLVDGVKSPMVLTGAEFRLEITGPEMSITLLSADDELEISSNEIVWDVTVGQSNQIPLGRLSRYKLKRVDGSADSTYLEGYIEGT